jgi:phosphate transport system protein
MAELAEKALKDCLEAFINNDHQMAYAIILRDLYVDEKEKEIDRLCLEFLIRQQPVAHTLRFVYSTMKINLEMERVGDYAESVARYILRLKEKPPEVLKERIIQMGNLAINMFHDATEGFLNQDEARVRKLIGVEEVVDSLRIQINKILVIGLQEQTIPFEVFDPLSVITRRLERVSDQARNICMEALYTCTGEYVKHRGSSAFRILFVDGHHSCRGLMAEAIACSMEQPKFVFSSAGVDPRPISTRTVEFMQSKGLDISRIVPKSIHQIPHIDHYQVVVALSKGARKAFADHPRKIVFLEWLLPDPSENDGSVEDVKKAYDEAFEYIQSHVKALVQAILGQKDLNK